MGNDLFHRAPCRLVSIVLHTVYILEIQGVICLIYRYFHTSISLSHKLKLAKRDKQAIQVGYPQEVQVH